MKVLLVNPITGERGMFAATPNLGLGYLATALRNNGFEADIWDGMKKDMTAVKLEERLRKADYDAVGFQVRFTDKSSSDNLVKLMTDGILLAETQSDRFLNNYDTLIIDEAHERSLNVDFLLGYIKQLIPKRPELKRCTCPFR